jgi:predicted Zn-dependent protease with MMP-like domain
MILPMTEFEALVAEALDDLPDFFRDKMENVAVLVEPWPGRDALARAGVAQGQTLLGLYTGVPLTQRTQGYNMVPPDTITLYQGTIEMRAGGDPAAIRYWARHVFLHELAHHFGISDARLRELGAY